MPAYCPYCGKPLNGGKFCPACGTPLYDLDTGTNDSVRTADTPSHLLQPGTILQSRYEVQDMLGEGGFGITYVGLDRVLDIKVAIKEYFPSAVAMRDSTTSTQVTSRYGGTQGLEQGISRFVDEARVLARMSKQRYIVHTSNCFRENGTAYIVMDYVEGQTLKQLAEARGGKIPADELLPLVEPLLGALGALHDKGLIHRDISPDNIMLTTDNEVCLLDFGCARQGVGGNETLTVMLKYDYAPIEQYTNTGQGPWTDVYGLCATLYACLCGVAVPNAPARLADDQIKKPTSLGVSLTPAQERGLLKGLAVKPEERLQSMAQLHDALYGPDATRNTDKNITEKTRAIREPIELIRDNIKNKRMSPRLIAAIAACVIVLVAVVAIVSNSLGGSTRSNPIDDIEVEQPTTRQRVSNDSTSATSFSSDSSDDTSFPDLGTFAGSSRFKLIDTNEEDHFTVYTYQVLGDATEAVDVITTFYSLVDSGMETIDGKGLSSQYELNGNSCIDLGFNYAGTGDVYEGTFSMGDPDSPDADVQILLQCIAPNDNEMYVKFYLPEGIDAEEEDLTYDSYKGLTS